MRKKRRAIHRQPQDCNYFLVDTCFLVNKYLKPGWISDSHERRRVESCQDWWKEIERQINADQAKVYVPDLCIAEAFKVFARKNYVHRIFVNGTYAQVRRRLRRDVHLPLREARKQKRKIRYHDMGTSRDVVISVDRFFEKMYKERVNVQIVDLILLATGKYLMDFYGFTRKNLFIVTMDKALYKLARGLTDVPTAFDPTLPRDTASKVFR